MSINNFSQMQNTKYPNPGTAPQTILKNESGVMDAYGTVVPVSGTAGFVTGCTFKNSNGGTSTSLYVNEGSVTSCNFVVVDDVPSAFGTAAGRGPSPLIWDDCPVLEYTLNPQLGSHVFDDLHSGITVAANVAVGAAAATGTVGQFAAFTLIGTAISTKATDTGGVVDLTVTTDEDADCRIAFPQNIEVAGMFKFAAGKKLWMETRIKVDNVTDAKINLFAGFMEEARMATGELIAVAGGATADVDYVGFRIDEADGDAFQTHYNTVSGGHTVLSATAGVITINNFHKLGIYSDGTTVTFYIDGVALADTVNISAANFPDGEEMGFYFGQVAASATTIVSSIDWMRIAQEY
ncbi:MAG: hypothetical protein FVQ80_11125 [Planctomycetes bacterium]|nr:hypothetical protein [Planctomycetota bacterium]